MATIIVPAPKAFPVAIDKVFLQAIRPRHIMSTIIGGQIDAVCLVVAGDNYSAAIKDAMFAQVLFVDQTSGGAAAYAFM